MYNINNNNNINNNTGFTYSMNDIKKEEEYEFFLNTLFEKIHEKYGFYRSKL